ncbi:hypothetical protein RsS62_07720 [Rhizobium dioscoreae]|nr:hypothetical protein RsS62_07720 [Rhizobium dioscoreae]
MAATYQLPRPRPDRRALARIPCFDLVEDLESIVAARIVARRGGTNPNGRIGQDREKILRRQTEIGARQHTEPIAGKTDRTLHKTNQGETQRMRHIGGGKEIETGACLDRLPQQPRGSERQRDTDAKLSSKGIDDRRKGMAQTAGRQDMNRIAHGRFPFLSLCRNSGTNAVSMSSPSASFAERMARP